MSNTFDPCAIDKFNRGQKEHKRPWNAENIDWKKEIKDEFLDIYWYSDFSPWWYKIMARGCARVLWWITERMT